MSETERKKADILSPWIVGRVEPSIYAFTTLTIPAYLKVGDTYRPVSERIREWSTVYEKLNHVFTGSAVINQDTIFRDHQVHEFLINEKCRQRLTREDLEPGMYFSREFFKDATVSDVIEAIDDIRRSAEEGDCKYHLYTPERLPKELHYRRGDALTPRANQQEVIDRFRDAVSDGRTDLLMYAVMRFGKTFTSLCCANEMEAGLVLVVTAKPQVREEWKKAVESIGNFKDYIFADVGNLKRSDTFIRDKRQSGKRVVLFLSLQDLKGKQLKHNHKEVFGLEWDLLIVDETHFGAYAKEYGSVLREGKTTGTNAERKRQMHGVETLKDLEGSLKKLKRRITLHLSGTPYRILMGDKFEEKDIIAYVQYSDIATARDRWDNSNRSHPEADRKEEWENPYYGFPEMVRFAFTPNQSSLLRLKQLKEANGGKTSFSELFKPSALTAGRPDYKTFVHEDVVIDFLKSIDGSKNDCNVLGFLDNQLIKQGKLCRHIVMVLPYCASCDAMETLICSHTDEFRNLGEYEIINISGADISKRPKDTEAVKTRIAQAEQEGRKTLTLTVNRMLTGNTVPEWDTMLFLKQSSSPEEYDQAIFRLQNPFVEEYTNSEGKIIKFNKKPQTILVDFDPERMFVLQETRSRIHNQHTGRKGNDRLRERIETELSVSPVITSDHNKLREVTATDILEQVMNYAATRSVADEALDMPEDIALLDNENIRKFISLLSPIDAKQGLFAKAHKSKDGGDGDDVEPQESDSEKKTKGKENKDKEPTKSEEAELVKKLKTFYSLILFFSFLTEERVTSLHELIRVMRKSADNRRICTALGLEKTDLKQLQKHIRSYTLSDLDYKISRINKLSHDTDKSPQERAETALAKFGRMSASEIVTPLAVADEMVAALPDDLFDRGPVLDIASKQGEFTLALMRRYGAAASGKVYSVCTSRVAYEFTRKIYRLLNQPVSNIFDSFTTYDLIVNHEAGQGGKKRKYTLNEPLISKLKKMNFAATIGNPPYQENLVNTSDEPIYHLFMDVSFSISRLVTLITPARYIFNAGKTPIKWNKERLHDPFFKILKYTPKSKEVFPSYIDIKGGIATSVRDMNRECGPIIKYTPYQQLNSILQKVSYKAKTTICDIIFPQNKFNLNELFKKYPNVKNQIGSDGREKRLTTSIFSLQNIFTSDKKMKSDIRILGLVSNVREWRWVSSYLIETHPSLDKWKVFIPKSNGSGEFGETLSTPFISGPGTGITQSFMTFGAFDTKEEAEACLKYLKTKFCRSLLGVSKVTQDNPKDTWEHVPMQDFSGDSDIDWGKTVEEIDRELYKKYGLSDEEASFIEAKVKPMS